jgi:hypothetical protein
MNRRRLTSLLLYSLALVVLILFEYGETFNFYFVGDDFAFIELVRTEKMKILWKPSCFYHYYPLGLLLIVLPSVFNIFEPSYYAAVSYLFYLLCSLLVMMLYRKIAGGLTWGFAAAVLYATAVPNSEVIYWKTGTQTLAMASFSLISLMLFAHSLEKRSKLIFLASIAAFILSMLCIEQGVVTFGFLFLYDLIFHSFPLFRISGERKRARARFIGRMFVFLSVPVSMTVIKMMLGAQLSPFRFSQLFWRIPHLTVETLIRLYDFNRLTFAFPLSSIQVGLLTLAFTLVFAAYLSLRRTASGLFFFLSSLGSILTISLAAGGPNERYFCLPLAFFSCFVVLFLKDLVTAAGHLIQKKFPEGRKAIGATAVQKMVFGGLCLSLALSGLRGNLHRRQFWSAASQIERNIVGTVENLYLTGSLLKEPGKKLYLLNAPAFMVTKRNSIFYICSNSLMPDLRFRLAAAADDIELAATGNLFQMKVNGEDVIYRARGRQNVIDNKRIKQLVGEGHLFFQFSPAVMNVIPLKTTR